MGRSRSILNLRRGDGGGRSAPGTTRLTLLSVALVFIIAGFSAIAVGNFQNNSNRAHEAELSITRLRVVFEEFDQFRTVYQLHPEDGAMLLGKANGYLERALVELDTLERVAPGDTQRLIENNFDELVATLQRARLILVTNPDGLDAYVQSTVSPARDRFDDSLNQAEVEYHERANAQQHRAKLGMWIVLSLAGLCIIGLAIVNEHIRRKATGLVRRKEAHFRSLVQYGGDLISVIDKDRRIRFQSPSIDAMLGYTPEQVTATSFADLVSEADHAAFDHLIEEALARPAQAVTGELRLKHAGGGERIVEVIANNLTDHPDVQGIVLTSRDLTERIEAASRTSFQATHDSLTGLPNRRLFLDRLTQAFARAARSTSSISVIFVDLNDFKMINDRLGHAVGDDVLISVARRLEQSIRQSDTAARLGGDEFIVMIESHSEAESAIVADRIASALERPHLIGIETIPVAVSLGLATRAITDDPDELIRRADLAMYACKHAGAAVPVEIDQSRDVRQSA